MLFVLHDFVMDTLKGMSSVYPRWQVQQIALGYYAKGWIDDSDLSKIAEWYEVPKPESDSDPYGENE